MKDVFKLIRNGFIFGSSALIILGIGGYFLIKARTSTNPNIADPDTSALYVNSNETLTAAKRNTLVSKSLNKSIQCSKIGGTLSLTTAGGQNYVFSASDCGGTVPDSTYVGAISYIEIAGGSVSAYRVINPGQTRNSITGPAIRFRHTAASGTYNISVIYVKN